MNCLHLLNLKGVLLHIICFVNQSEQVTVANDAIAGAKRRQKSVLGNEARRVYQKRRDDMKAGT